MTFESHINKHRDIEPIWVLTILGAQSKLQQVATAVGTTKISLPDYLGAKVSTVMRRFGPVAGSSAAEKAGPRKKARTVLYGVDHTVWNLAQPSPSSQFFASGTVGHMW